MSQDFYQKMQNTAQTLFKKFNQGQIAYVIETPGTGPADNPGTPTPVTIPLTGATARGVSYKFLKNSDVLTTDLEVHLPGGIVDVKPQGYFTIDGVPHKIVQIERIPAAGIAVAWTVVVRK